MAMQSVFWRHKAGKIWKWVSFFSFCLLLWFCFLPFQECCFWEERRTPSSAAEESYFCLQCEGCQMLVLNRCIHGSSFSRTCEERRGACMVRVWLFILRTSARVKMEIELKEKNSSSSVGFQLCSSSQVLPRLMASRCNEKMYDPFTKWFHSPVCYKFHRVKVLPQKCYRGLNGIFAWRITWHDKCHFVIFSAVHIL